MDLLIRGARLRGREGLFDIGIEGDRIAKIGEVSEEAERVIEAYGRLVAPTFADAHSHLDKAGMNQAYGSRVGKTTLEAREIVSSIRSKFRQEDVKQRAKAFLEDYVMKGVTKIRTHVDVASEGGLEGIKGIISLKEEYRDIVDIQVVAFPQDGLVKDPEAQELMRKALELGADVVGGVPDGELTHEDSKKHVDISFSLAKEFNKSLDLHIDVVSDHTARNLEYVAAKAIKEGFLGRVNASHALALAYYPEYYARHVISLVKQAGISVITCPSTTMLTGSLLDPQPRPRGITRVKELIEAGVNVACGCDNILDPYTPFGDPNPLRNAHLICMAAQFFDKDWIERSFDMITVNAAKAMGLGDYGLEVGMEASLNIIDAVCVSEALRLLPPIAYVIRKGRVIAESKISRIIRRG